MKKTSSYIKIIFFISLIVSCSTASSREEKKFLLNQELKTIIENWNGNPLDADGNFINLEFPFKSTFYDFLKWQLQPNPDKEEKKNDTFKLKVLNAQNFADSNQDGICWLGHSTFIIRLEGITLITDPIFGTPAPLMKRLTRLPITPSKLKNIDYILISHDHYDHLHGESIKLLVQNNPDIKILTGLKTGEYMKDWLDGRIFQEAGWYQQYSITPDNLKITYLPTRHWSSRGMFGRNQRLWGAFMIQSENYTIYFGGDSGYGSHYKETSELFKNIDYAILGIGAYKPEWLCTPIILHQKMPCGLQLNSMRKNLFQCITVLLIYQTKHRGIQSVLYGKLMMKVINL